MTDATSVTKTQQRLDDHAVRNIRWSRDDDEPWSLIAGLVRPALQATYTVTGEDVAESLPSTDVGSQAQRGGRRILEINPHSPGTQGKSQRRAK